MRDCMTKSFKVFIVLVFSMMLTFCGKEEKKKELKESTKTSIPYVDKDFKLKKYTVLRISKDDRISISTLNDPQQYSDSQFINVHFPVIDYGKEKFRMIKAFIIDNKSIMLVTRQHGIWKTSNFGQDWKRIDTNLPVEMVYPFKEKRLTKPVRSFSMTKDYKTFLILMPELLLKSTDFGKTFVKLPLKNRHVYSEMLTAVVDPEDEQKILIGTSVRGVYYSKDGGLTVTKISHGTPGEPLNHPNFLEETRALAFDDKDKDTFYTGYANGNGVYVGSLKRKVLRKLNIPELSTYPDGEFCSVHNLVCHDGILYITDDCGKAFYYDVNSDQKTNRSDNVMSKVFQKSDELISINKKDSLPLIHKYYYPVERSFPPDKRARGVKALYISYGFTQGDNYDKLLNFLKELRLNAVVLNLKDDYGRLRVPTDNPLVLKVPGACIPYKNVVRTIKKLRSDGIYVIGRLVCFKDKQLYKYDNYKYAVKNKNTGSRLVKGPEYWVDIFSDYVWDYNIAMAKAIEKAGASEIQFDYIRSPDLRGKMKKKDKYDFRKDGMQKREALVSFLRKAKQELSVPTSMDTFGFDSMYQTNWIGQDITMMSNEVDVVSPMFYPSHYTGGYAQSYKGRGKKIYYTIYLSCKRVMELTNGVIIRPYIQGFYYKDNKDGYCVDYIGWELDGLKDAGLEDFVFWNDLSGYTILTKGLWKYYGVLDQKDYRKLKKNLPRKPRPSEFNQMLDQPITLESIQ